MFKRMKTMKILVAVMMLSISGSVMAQITKEQLKERQELKQMSKAELSQKASKAARKEAKRLAGEGWQAAPGALPLDRQLDRSYMMQQEFDDDMFPKYLMGEAMSIGENYDAAKMQAQELAKLSLAGQIQTEVTALIEQSVANSQLVAEEAASVAKMVAESKSLISQRIGRIIPVVEVYRVLQNKNKEMAKAAAKSAIRAELAKQGEELQKKLDEVLGW